MNHHKRILIVDDEDQVTFVLHNSLKKLGDGYEMVIAHNGQEALEKLRQAAVDVMITDIKMPGVDGLALTEVVYAIAPATRVIWITAYDHWEADARRLGVYRYLLKPLDVREIRQVVSEALEAAATQASDSKAHRLKQVLIVDDEPQEALTLCDALAQSSDSQAGRYDVKITLVLEEALSSLKAEHFDLVVSGLHESGQDNLAFIRQVRRISPHMRTLLIAGSDQPCVEDQARQLATTCLSGPLDLARFTAAVQGILA